MSAEEELIDEEADGNMHYCLVFRAGQFVFTEINRFSHQGIEKRFSPDERVVSCSITYGEAHQMGVLKISRSGYYRSKVTAVGHEVPDEVVVCAHCGVSFPSYTTKCEVVYCSLWCMNANPPCKNCGCDRNTKYQTQLPRSISEGRCMGCYNWWKKHGSERPSSRWRKR